MGVSQDMADGATDHRRAPARRARPTRHGEGRGGARSTRLALLRQLSMGLGGPRAVNPPAQSGDYQTSHTNAAMANRHFWQKLARKCAMPPAYTHKTICH